MTHDEILHEVANSITSSSANSDWKLKTLDKANQSLEEVLDNLPNFKMTFLNALSIQEVTTDDLRPELSQTYDAPLPILHHNHLIRLEPNPVPCSGIKITEMIDRLKTWIDNVWITLYGTNLSSQVVIRAKSGSTGLHYMAQLTFYTEYN